MEGGGGIGKMTRSLCRRTMVVPLRGGDISRFKVTSENSYQGIEFPWRSPPLPPPPGSHSPPAIIRAADNENLFSPLPRGACETNQPTNPFPILHPSCSCVSRRHVHPPSSSFSSFDFHPIHPTRVSFATVPSLYSARTTEILVSDNREPNSICNHRRWRAASSLSSSTIRFPWNSRNSKETVSFWRGGYSREGNRGSPPPCIYTHLQDSSVNSGACSLGNWIRDLIEEGG